MYRNKVLTLVVFLLFLASFHDSSFADIDSMTVSNHILKDADDSVASSLNSGQQASIFVTIENNEATSQPFTAIIELRDVDGVTFDLQWQIGLSPVERRI